VYWGLGAQFGASGRQPGSLAAHDIDHGLYLALRGAGLDGCHVSSTEIEEAESPHAFAAG
jgi:hypothetical protein